MHGSLIMGLLSTTASMISRRSVARGSKAVSVSLGYDKVRFLRPVFINDTLTARYTVEEIDTAAARSRSRVEVVNQSGELCLAGTHIMKWVSQKARPHPNAPWSSWPCSFRTRTGKSAKWRGVSPTR